jgi:hypothetical protein
MIPSRRRELRALHEAGHAALALYFGMLGPGEISILTTEEGEGAVPLAMDLQSFRNKAAIEDRAAICMAGVAADLGIRSGEMHLNFTGPIDWYWMICHCEDLRPDVEKACVLHFVSQHVDLIWQRVVRTLGERHDLTEDDLLASIHRDAQYVRPAYESVNCYFNTARNMLTMPKCLRFVVEVSRLLVERGTLPTSAAAEIWSVASANSIGITFYQ